MPKTPAITHYGLIEYDLKCNLIKIVLIYELIGGSYFDLFFSEKLQDSKKSPFIYFHNIKHKNVLYRID